MTCGVDYFACSPQDYAYDVQCPACAYIPDGWGIVSQSSYNTGTPAPWGRGDGPSAPDPSCPSANHILTTYAVTTLVISAISLVAGNRKVIKFLTFGLLGRRGSNSWKWTWLLTFSLQVVAAVTIASIIKREKDFVIEFNVTLLALLLLTRPRLSFFFLAISLAFENKDVEKFEDFFDDWTSGLRDILSAELCALIDDFQAHYPRVNSYDAGTYNETRRQNRRLFHSALKELESRIRTIEMAIRQTGNLEAQTLPPVLSEEKVRLKEAVLRAHKANRNPSVVSYGASANSAVGAELLLWATSMIIYGMIVKDADKKGSLLIGSPIYNNTPAAAKLMQGAALVQLLPAIFVLMGLLMFPVVYILRIVSKYLRQSTRGNNESPNEVCSIEPDNAAQTTTRGRPSSSETNLGERDIQMVSAEYHDFASTVVFWIFACNWWLTWMFWAGFLNSAQQA
jgi:hypothetical protein